MSTNETTDPIVTSITLVCSNQRNQLMEELQAHLDHPALTAFLVLMVLMAKPDFLATLDPQVHPDQLDPVARFVKFSYECYLI